ncbi:MAG: redoxin domain-containing protein [Planctomycetes bacterium]|nr:redoxin domain-containing protein [Planctomycetota bacterium]
MTIVSAIVCAFAADAIAQTNVEVRNADGETIASDGSAFYENDELYIRTDLFNEITGIEIHGDFDEGLIVFCTDESCVTSAMSGSNFFERDEKNYISKSALEECLDVSIFEYDENGKRSIVIAFATLRQPSVGEEGFDAEVGKPAPNFALPDRDGNIVRLSDFRGKRVLLDFWASWCTCRASIPKLQEMYEAHKNESFVAVAVAMDAKGFETAGKYYDDANVTYPALVDKFGQCAITFGVNIVPRWFFIDELGVVRRSGRIAIGDREKRQLGDWLAVPLRVDVEGGSAAESDPFLDPEHWRSLLRENPQDQRLWLHLAESLYSRGETADALEVLENEALPACPRSQWIRHRIAVYHLEAGDEEAALDHLYEAWRLDPLSTVIKKLIWSIENPERFYSGDIDELWELRRELRSRRRN